MKESFLDNVAVLIPSLDPDEEMVKYVSGLVERGFKKIIVVDDGSQDDNQKYFDDIQKFMEVVLVRHVINQGKGRALKTGFNYILNVYTESEVVGVVTADADGQHSVEDTVKVAKHLSEAKSLVLGMRNFDEKDVPFKSRFGNKITTAFFSILYGKTIKDTQTGLRGIPYSFISSCLGFVGERFEYEIVMLIEAVRQKQEIIEEPIETIYINSNRATHFHAIKDSVRIYKVIFSNFMKYTMSGIVSFVVDIGLFALLTKVFFATWEVAMATFWGSVVARAVSSFLNYSINRTKVFNDNQNMRKTIIKYYLLCLLQLMCSWILVVMVFGWIKWDTTLIKALVDLILFFISYQVQRLWVFKEKTI